MQVSRLQQEYDKKELNLKADHSEELKRAHLQAENELKEVHIAFNLVEGIKINTNFSFSF